jgi:competence CoiA-like predicted nuclease
MSPRSDWMFDVRVKRMFLDPVSKSRVWKLVNRNVKEIKKGEVFGCVHCGKELRLYQGAKVEWHAQHKFPADAAKCPGAAERAQAAAELVQKA